MLDRPSLKVEVFTSDLTSVLSGAVTSIGTDGAITLGDETLATKTTDHADALAQMLEALAYAGITLDNLTGAAHRVVHGGTILTQPARVTPQVIAANQKRHSIGTTAQPQQSGCNAGPAGRSPRPTAICQFRNCVSCN